MTNMQIMIILLGISIICVTLAGACLYFLPTQYAIMGITFIGGVWTPVTSGMLIYWFNTQVKTAQLNTRLDIANARKDILTIKSLINGNYVKMLRQLETLRTLNQNQRDIIDAQKRRDSIKNPNIQKEL